MRQPISRAPYDNGVPSTYLYVCRFCGDGIVAQTGSEGAAFKAEQGRHGPGVCDRPAARAVKVDGEQADALFGILLDLADTRGH
jgi:hypothetical protein